MDSSTLLRTQVSAIGQVAGAFATVAAVIVALWIALSERRPNIKLRAGLRLIIPGDGSPATDIVAFKANRPYRDHCAGHTVSLKQRAPAQAE